MQGLRSGLLVAAIFLAVFGASYTYLQLTAPPLTTGAAAPEATDVAAIRPAVDPELPPPTAGQGAPAPMPLPGPDALEPAAGDPEAQNAPPMLDDFAPGAAAPVDDPPPAAAADPPGGSGPPPLSGGAPPPSAPVIVRVPSAPSAPPPSAPAPSAPAPVAPAPSAPAPSAAPPSGGGMASLPRDTAPTTYHPPPPPPAAPAPVAPSSPPPRAVAAPSAPPPAPRVLPPAAAGDPPPAPAGSKVLSYFQQTKTELDTSKAFGFVLLPKLAITAEEKQTQKQFCEILLASLDFMTPGAVAAATVRTEILATYWPIVASRRALEINAAFEDRNCDQLLAWYDHRLARSLASRAGVAGLSGPLLLTWPAAGADGAEARNPLIVDFAKADYQHATKALQYWFRQVRGRPELWTNRIREGTIRAELADAVNDTAGVVLAVLYGKWDSVNTVATN
jgi:hypothetical protein